MSKGKVESEVAAAAEPEAIVQWDQVKGLARAGFDELITWRRKVKKQIELLEETIDKINNKLMVGMMSADVKTVGVDGARVTLVPAGKTTRFDRNKCYARLLELGVKPVVVAKAYKEATTEGEREAYVLVTEPKEKA